MHGTLRRLTRRPRMLATGWAARARYVLPTPLPADYDDATAETIRRVRRHTMTSPARLEALVRAVEHVAVAPVPGAIVECGVWRGGSMMAAALTLRRLGVTDRDLYLFDTFSGMTAPTPEDVDSAYDGFSLQAMWRRRRRGDMNWIGVPADEVRAAMDSTGYPAARVHLVEGPVEETVPARAPEEIALLRLDTDWYASTRHEMEHLYPRLVPGGVLVLDDYGHYAGARRAVDEFLAARGESLLLQRIDYTGRIAVKPS
ncbi:MAG TPA: TylF/MycF/NovP-related O-methyltransferase [Solirubrobacteraceae bacterium]|nr:TylF/MycF/NovP-related O-methyltransferase [Solirubrobacteraceae bacterium]